MTDNEIIKALECCSEIARCSECPYSEIEDCVKRNTIDAKNLINCQKAEIERLQKENHRFDDIGKMYSEIKSEARKEFAERIKEKCGVIDGYTIVDNLLEEMEKKT